MRRCMRVRVRGELSNDATGMTDRGPLKYKDRIISKNDTEQSLEVIWSRISEHDTSKTLDLAWSQGSSLARATNCLLRMSFRARI